MIACCDHCSLKPLKKISDLGESKMKMDLDMLVDYLTLIIPFLDRISFYFHMLRKQQM